MVARTAVLWRLPGGTKSRAGSQGNVSTPWWSSLRTLGRSPMDRLRSGTGCCKGVPETCAGDQSPRRSSRAGQRFATHCQTAKGHESLPSRGLPNAAKAQAVAPAAGRATSCHLAGVHPGALKRAPKMTWLDLLDVIVTKILGRTPPQKGPGPRGCEGLGDLDAAALTFEGGLRCGFSTRKSANTKLRESQSSPAVPTEGVWKRQWHRSTRSLGRRTIPIFEELLDQHQRIRRFFLPHFAP